MAKRNRFSIKRYFPDLPPGWGLYSDMELEEKTHFTRFLEGTQYYFKLFQSGNEQAIFEFVKKCPECFREVWPLPDASFATCYSDNNFFLKGRRSWVIEQIEKWKAEDTPEARKKLKKLFSAYADSRGQREKPAKNDWLIYRQIKDRIGKGKTFEKAVEGLINDADDGKLDSEIQEVVAKNVQDDQVGYYNTFREIYYKLSKLEKEYNEDAKVTEKNLRFQYFLPHKGKMTIPKNYVDQFQEEYSLYFAVEWLRKGFISFPSLREGLLVYPGVRPFEEERLPLKKALEKVSKEKKVSLDKLKEIYTNLKNIEAIYFGSACLDVLKEL